MGRHYCHLRLDERRKLANWLDAIMPVSEIADRLGRDPSTIYRDIKRNRYTDTEIPELNGYHALVAQDKYEKRRAIHRKLIVHPKLKEAIEDCQRRRKIRPRGGAKVGQSGRDRRLGKRAPHIAVGCQGALVR